MGKHGDIASYVSLIKRNDRFRALFFGEVINSCGGWFSVVALISLVNTLSSSSSIYVSLLLLVRLLPGTILFPITGAVADTYDRATTMRLTCYFEAVVISLCMLVNSTAQLPLLFMLITLQFCSQAFYEPSRRALQPVIVSQEELDIATTLDTFSWSLMGAVGASLGGWVTSVFGSRFCFFIDAISYIIAAQVVLKLVGIPLVKEAPESKKIVDVKKVSFIQAVKDSVLSIKEGWVYITSPGNWDVGVLCCIKASGAAIWGVADVLNVKVSEEVGMQQLGDASSTLGFIFASVGLGCFIGPLIFNKLFPPSPKNWLRGCVLAQALLCIGYFIIVYADTIYPVLLGTIIRSCGSAVLWVFSTLVVQQRAKSEMLGRVFALELAVCTLCEGATVVLAGVMFDKGHFSVKSASMLVGVLGSIVVLFWGRFVQSYNKSLGEGGQLVPV